MCGGKNRIWPVIPQAIHVTNITRVVPTVDADLSFKMK